MTGVLDLAEISDRLEILDLYARYVNYVDQPDYAGLAEHVFVDETVYDLSSAAGPVLTFREIRESGFFDGDGIPHRFHITSNLVVDFAPDRDTATAVAKTFNPWAISDDAGTRSYHVHGRYHDELTRTPAGWRITSRTWEQSWVTGWRDGGVELLRTMADVR